MTAHSNSRAREETVGTLTIHALKHVPPCEFIQPCSGASADASVPGTLWRTHWRWGWGPTLIPRRRSFATSGWLAACLSDRSPASPFALSPPPSVVSCVPPCQTATCARSERSHVYDCRILTPILHLYLYIRIYFFKVKIWYFKNYLLFNYVKE